MQEVIYNSKMNLSELYPNHLFKNLIRVFPRLSSIIPKNIISNAQPILIDKFLFYRMILEKVKTYFEIGESFVISESIDIILKDIKSKDKGRIKNKIELPIIINKKEHIKFININTTKSTRNFSTKNSRKVTPNVNQENNFINRGKSNYKNPNKGQIFLNLDINKNTRMKLVRFIENNGFDNATNISNNAKGLSKKSNLKSVTTNNKKVITINISNQNKTVTNNINLKETNGKKELFIQTKAEYPLRNKTTGIERTFISVPQENKEVIFPDRINYIYEQNFKNFINIDDKNFNIFEFESKVGKENTLLLVSKYIYNYFKFGQMQINQSKFDNWVEKITKGYNRNNSYHHDLHAADITHTSFIFFKYGLIHEIAKFDISMICAVILSCICHDYKHPGVNSNYLIETDDDAALIYNDISVLENMHASEAFKLMHANSNYNIFEGFDRETYKKMRKRIISCVLSTDMINHNLAIDFLNNHLSNKNKPEDNDKQEYMNLVVHGSDISNPTKIYDIYSGWAKLILEEFFSQGDKEKKIGIKCSYDRDKVSIYQNQLDFMNFIVLPFFSLVTKVFPKLDFLLVNLNNNKQKVKQLEEDNKRNNKNL